VWYKFANQFGEPTPFTPEPSRALGANEQEALVNVMPALEKRIKELANPKKDPYKQTLEGQLADLHHENKNLLDPNGAEADALWRGWGIKAQSDAAMPQDKNWPAALSKVQV
jgi:hypothetical protein